MPIYSEHPQYIKHKRKWEVVRDAIDSCVDTHIIPICYGKDRRSQQRNENFKKRAIFDNFTINTRLGLVGTALREDPLIELPPELDYMEQAATGNGLTLKQVIRKSLGENIETGRYGGLVDYPNAPLGLTAEQVASSGFKPKMYLYKAEDILNWEVDSSTGIDKLTFVVLREEVRRRVDGYEWACGYQYRVLELDNTGAYYYYVADKDLNQRTEDFYPRQNGQLMDHIPFYFLGAEDNDPEVDNSPLYPIAHVNIGHLRNSASYEDNLAQHGQGSLFITSTFSIDEWKRATEGKALAMDAGTGHFIGAPGSDAKLLQLEPGQEIANAMRHKEEQMMMLGAYFLVKENQSNVSTDTSKMQFGPKVSRLDTLVTNTEDWLEKMLRECAAFIGANPELVLVQMSHNFIPENADPLIMAQMAAQWQMGLMPHDFVLDYNRKVDLIPRDMTNEEIKAQIKTEGPVGMDDFSGNQVPTMLLTNNKNNNNQGDQ